MNAEPVDFEIILSLPFQTFSWCIDLQCIDLQPCFWGGEKKRRCLKWNKSPFSCSAFNKAAAQSSEMEKQGKVRKGHSSFLCWYDIYEKNVRARLKAQKWKIERVSESFMCVPFGFCIQGLSLHCTCMHACTLPHIHTHGKQWCGDISLSLSEAQSSIYFSQWPRNDWHSKQKLK